jgi:hypothetical protein
MMVSALKGENQSWVFTTLRRTCHPVEQDVEQPYLLFLR